MGSSLDPAIFDSPEAIAGDHHFLIGGKDDDFDLAQIPDAGSSADDYIITKEDNEVVEHLLSFLSQKEYSVMKLFLDGYSYKQIAEKLDITPKSADNALSRARKKLKALL